jgi:hypothetical protein
MDEGARQVSLPYRHTQIGVLTVVGLSAGFLTQLCRAVRDVRRHRRWAWVSVSRAVELGLRDARIFTIGSDEPEVLLAAIERACALRAPAAA